MVTNGNNGTFGQNAISNESPHISLGLARELSEREVQIERTHNKES